VTTIAVATTAADLADARDLFHAYADSLGFDLGFQDVERELAELPGAYAPPRGTLLLARSGSDTVGCVAVQPLDEATAELKRLFVRDGARGSGVGRLLAERAVEAARELGYEAIRLDTVPAMEAARALYRSLGFREIEPYRYNPIPGTGFMELRLREPALG